MAEEKQSILVIDDQPTAVWVMSRILSDDYEVHVATDGVEGIELAKDKRPDLILLDMVMPKMSGIDVCIQLKSLPETQNTPIMFVTSMDDPQNEARGFKAGAVDYITKPPSPQIVLARVKVQLALRRQRQFIHTLASGNDSDLDAIRAEARKLLGF